jgi:carboxyl-terminal processing protease
MNKDPERAKSLLLAAAAPGKGALQSTSLSWAYFYLGYIADRAEKREEAIQWYTKAVTVPDAASNIRELSRMGLKAPMKWIRHLDETSGSGAPSSPPVKALTIGNGYVTYGTPPTGLTVAKTLSPKERQENFDILWEAIDKTYACFKLKSIDWAGVRRHYQKRLESVASADDFYLLLFQMVNELKDTHSWLKGYRPPVPNFSVELSVDLFEGRPYVVATTKALPGVELGSEILAVDGLTVEQKMDSLRPFLNARSSERAYRREAARRLLAGERESEVTLKLRVPDGRIETLTLKREFSLTPPPSIRNIPIELTKQRFVHFGRHPSGLGFIWIESFNGREEIADEFDRAMKALKDTPGLILDIRDNQGGFGNAQPRIVGRFIQEPAMVAISYVKNGPGHEDLRRSEARFGPSGAWQYSRPVALLVNDVTGSAADLFACYLRSIGRVVTIGSTTHGNLSGVAVHIVLPCGLVVRTSNGYVSDAKDRTIEVNGNAPDIVVEPTIADYLQSRDPVFERAVASLLGASKPPR